MQAIIISILKSLLTEKLIKVLAAEAIEMIVQATDNDVDNRMAQPILDESGGSFSEYSGFTSTQDTIRTAQAGGALFATANSLMVKEGNLKDVHE